MHKSLGSGHGNIDSQNGAKVEDAWLGTGAYSILKVRCANLKIFRAGHDYSSSQFNHGLARPVSR